jgi:3',5'-cyclic AMP phosphodiesterase CpdA
MKFAHFSDFHFAASSWSPLQFLSKRWLGNFNFLLSRRYLYDPHRLFSLPDFLEKEKVAQAVICGDLSTTGRKQEFSLAADLIKKIEAKGVQTTTIPGNHDHYTKKGYRKKWFYDYFPEDRLKTQTVTAKSLGNGWWIVALDTALATSWTSSRGFFSPETETSLIQTLSDIPKHDSAILINHFPFFQHDSPRKNLERGPALQHLLRQQPKVKLFLHGHTHRHCIADLRPDGLPIILDSGSAPHRQYGTWNLIDLTPQKCEVKVVVWKDGWNIDRKLEFAW